MAELADALDSKSSGRKAVWVRAPPPAIFCSMFDAGRWQFFTGFWCAVVRNEYENRADRRVKKREELKERREPSYDVVENRQQPQVFLILIHSL